MTSRTSAQIVKIIRKAAAYQKKAEDYAWGTLDLSKGQVSALKANLTRLAKKVAREETAGQHIAAAAASLNHTVTFKDELPPEPNKPESGVTWDTAIPAVFKVSLVRESGLSISDRPKVFSPNTGAQLAGGLIGDSDRENFVVIMLDTRGRVIGANIAHTGTIGQCQISAREIFKPAILSNARSVVFAHNHPSGDPSPSPEDIDLTKMLKLAGDILDIEVLDHLVIGEPAYKTSDNQPLYRFVSIAERGLM